MGFCQHNVNQKKNKYFEMNHVCVPNCANQFVKRTNICKETN